MSVAASAKVVTCACIIIKASSTASAKVSPPMPKPLVTVRITGLAMISPDGAGEGGREADDAALKMAGESVTKHSQPLHNNGVGRGIASATPG